MDKYYNDPRVSTKSTYGLMIAATKIDPVPGTISFDYLNTMKSVYPELATLSDNYTTPLKKHDIRFYTNLAFNTRILTQSQGSHIMSRYLQNHFHETRNYLATTCKEIFPTRRIHNVSSEFSNRSFLPPHDSGSQRQNTLHVQNKMLFLQVHHRAEWLHQRAKSWHQLP
jgi:hypothetical protein